MAEIIHFPPRDPDEPQTLYAAALARAGYRPEARQAVEEAYAAGYAQGYQDAMREAGERLKEIVQNEMQGLLNVLGKAQETRKKFDEITGRR